MTNHLLRLLIALSLLCWLATVSEAQVFEVTKTFKVEEAKQAVAVDDHHFYVINNSTIRKYKKSDGTLVTSFDGKSLGFTHLNSGVVIKGKLYCANSNFPSVPMLSSIEIFDTATLKPIGNYSFGIDTRGSLTWLDWKDGHWWAVFAQYSGKNAVEGKDNRWTTLVKLTPTFQQVGAWVFPDQLVKQFGSYSSSGGTWSPQGTLYCTGHDEAEVYELQIPTTGYTLQHIRTIPATGIAGQGIALDRSQKGKVVLLGIQRANNVVTISELN